MVKALSMTVYSGTDQVHTKVQDFLVKFGELLPTIFVSIL